LPETEQLGTTTAPIGGASSCLLRSLDAHAPRPARKSAR
jgi:hypothetical protein